MEKDHLEAVQNVVDRVSAYQDGAPEGTVAQELRSGLADVGVDLEEAQIDALARAVESSSGDVNVGDVLAD